MLSTLIEDESVTFKLSISASILSLLDLDGSELCLQHLWFECDIIRNLIDAKQNKNKLGNMIVSYLWAYSYFWFCNMLAQLKQDGH